MGNVRIKNDAGLDIRCGRVDLEIPEDAGKSDDEPGKLPSSVATKNVIARIPHESRIFDVKCDRAEYKSLEDSLELVGDVQGETPEGEIRGSRFKYDFAANYLKGDVGQFEVNVGNVMKSIEKMKNDKQKPSLR